MRDVPTNIDHVPPEVLFVCVHNAGRSQMAAALLNKLGGDRVNVRTAGSDPAAEINPAVVDAMHEIGIDLSQEFPAYGPNVWGISASDSERGYVAWGGPPRDPAIDGTVVPYAAAGSLAFTPDISLAALYERHGGRLTHEVRASMVGGSAEDTIRTVYTDLGLEMKPEAMAESAPPRTPAAD